MESENCKTLSSFPRQRECPDKIQADTNYNKVQIRTDIKTKPKAPPKPRVVLTYSSRQNKDPEKKLRKLSLIQEEVPEALPLMTLPYIQPKLTLALDDPSNSYQNKAGEGQKQSNDPCQTPSYTHSVPTFVRERLIKQIKTSKESRIGKPAIGIVVYVGSPVNGDIVIGNPDFVNEWLSYVKAAQERKILDIHDGILKISDLEKLCNVSILPGIRHEFQVKYEVHSELRCTEHKHDKRIWESVVYPSNIISCECISN